MVSSKPFADVSKPLAMRALPANANEALLCDPVSNLPGLLKEATKE